MDKQITTPRGIVTLRPAQETDAPAYRELRLEGLRNHPEAFGSDYAVNLTHPAAFWTDRVRLSGNERTLYFAVCNDNLIGTCAIVRGDSPKTCHSAFIVGVYVQPAWRGLGIADGLIAVCLEWAQQQGVKIVKLGVAATNTAAIRRYSKCGFTVYGIEPQAICVDGVMYAELLMAREV
jgi:RimJ/RimL family protein N-acetyltransferase